MQLAFSRLGDRLLYALRVIDDERKPAILWSILERDAEKAALNALAQGESCQVFLFNELAVNVAWTALPMTAHTNLAKIVETIRTGPADHAALKSDASAVLDNFHNSPVSHADLIVIDLSRAGGISARISCTRQRLKSTSEYVNVKSGNAAVRAPLLRWLRGAGIHPRVVGEFDDGALMKAFGRAGAGVFAVPGAIAAEVIEQYGVVALGATEAVRERFFLITVERRITQPAARVVSEAARSGLFFAPPPV